MSDISNTIRNHTITYRNSHSERLLLGNIVCNPSLISEYADTLSPYDFADADARYLYCVLQGYYAAYGDEEVTPERISAIAANLQEETGLRMPGMTPEALQQYLVTIRKLGIFQPADSEAYQSVKRYSMLRQLEAIGIDVREIYEREDFADLTAENVIGLIYEKLDPIANAASLHPHEDFCSNIAKRALRFFENPEIGLQLPFAFINEHMHGLCPNDFTLIGGLSNTGKGRFLMNVLIWLVAKEGQTVCLLSNEMTSEDFFKAMVCTIVNTPQLHDKNLKLPQSNIVQSRFKDDEGEYIDRLPDEAGMDFHARVVETSTECQEYEAVLQWWEDTFPGRFIFVNVANDYSTPRLKREIRRAKANGCTVIAYDTLKGYQSQEWSELVQATTDLSEVIKSDREGLIGLATFQLTDDTAKSKPEELTSMKIARAKGIMHLADNILMFMPLRDEQRDFYEVASLEEVDEDGESLRVPIDEDISIAAFRIVKNRRGGGKEKVYAVQNNLDLNRWEYIGTLVKAAPVRSKWNYLAV